MIVSNPYTSAADIIFTKQFVPIEDHLVQCGVGFTILRLPSFMDNNWNNLSTIKGQGKIYGPLDPNAPFSAIAVSDIGQAAATILSHPKIHIGKSYSLTAKPYTNHDLAAAFTHATGKQVTYVQVPFESIKSTMLAKGSSEWFIDGYLELLKLVNVQSPTMLVQDDFERLMGHPPLSIQQWTAQVGGAFA